MTMERIKKGSWVLLAATCLMIPSSLGFADGAAKAQPRLEIYLLATCPHCLEGAPKVKALIDQHAASSIEVFMGANSQAEIDSYFARASVKFPYVPLTINQMRERVQKVPGAKLTADGKIISTWSESIPTPLQIHDSLLPVGGHAVAKP